MTTIRRSALFKRQLLEITSSYRARAGSALALRFVDEIEACVAFIAGQPLACAVYARLEGHEFRKWRVSGFPVSVFFRLESPDAIVLEALYAHRMNISARLRDDVKTP